jgi:amphi-Trp domain-containing protein
MPRMDLVEITQKEQVSREEAAARLRDLADQLARHNDLEFERDGISFKVRVPDEVQLKVEFEVEDDGSELEVELTW